MGPHPCLWWPAGLWLLEGYNYNPDSQGGVKPHSYPPYAAFPTASNTTDPMKFTTSAQIYRNTHWQWVFIFVFWK